MIVEPTGLVVYLLDYSVDVKRFGWISRWMGGLGKAAVIGKEHKREMEHGFVLGVEGTERFERDSRVDAALVMRLPLGLVRWWVGVGVGVVVVMMGAVLLLRL